LTIHIDSQRNAQSQRIPLSEMGARAGAYQIGFHIQVLGFLGGVSEMLEGRCGRCSIITTSQLPIEEWHDVIGGATLDRLVRNACKISLRSEPMRKRQAKLTGSK
jgi:hypothetical protein